jgi:hypothetical protein
LEVLKNYEPSLLHPGLNNAKDGANAVGMVMDFKIWRRVTRTLFKIKNEM